MKRNTLILGGALLSMSLSAWPLDLLQAYEAAQQQDASLQAARSAAMMGRERLPQTRAQFLPSVSASFSQNNNQLESTTINFLGQEQTTNTGSQAVTRRCHSDSRCFVHN